MEVSTKYLCATTRTLLALVPMHFGERLGFHLTGALLVDLHACARVLGEGHRGIGLLLREAGGDFNTHAKQRMRWAYVPLVSGAQSRGVG